jgi:DNA-binding CsgD family transcriptional regulator/PAS domain-containing protein
LEPISPGITKALLDPLYEAATQPEMCEVFLRKASEVFHANHAAFIVYDPKTGAAAVRAALGCTDEMRRDAEELIGGDLWTAEILKYRETGSYSGSPEDTLPLEKFRSTRFYKDFFCKHSIEWAGAAVVFGPEGTIPSLAVTRSPSEPPFSANDKELLHQLLPHLGRVFKVHRAIAALRIKNAAGQSALDLIGAACVTLDRAGRLLSMNQRAEALIASGGALRVKDGHLMTALTLEQNALDLCIVPACACGDGRSANPGAGAVVLHSRQGAPLYVSVLPYHSGWALLEDCPAALVFITTPDEQGRGEHRLWHSMFALSPAECRVAEMMMHGMEVAEISEAIRIKVDTVRYYQKCVYRKTGVRGQGQLMRLLTRLPSSTR